MSAIAQAAVGKWPGILAALGIDESFLKNQHGPCPACGGKDRFRFDDRGGKGGYFCSACGSGDGLSLLQKVNGWSFAETARQVESVVGKCEFTQQVKTDYSNNEKRLKIIHSGLKPITHSDVVGKYLLGRGVSVLPDNDVYYHQGLDYYCQNDMGNSVKIGNFAAMVSIIRNLAGETCSYHITYLTKHGDKISNYPAKKFLPKIRELKGAAVQMLVPTDTLAVAEGVETALSYYQDTGTPCWSATNANLLMSIQIPKSVRNVVIVADEDESFTGAKAAYALAHRLKVCEGKKVNVIRLIGKPLDAYADCGIDADYNNYLQLKTGKLPINTDLNAP